MPLRVDGDGWVDCACGSRHWGRHGATGLLLVDGDRVLLQHRAPWSHQGGTWGVPGGARASGEGVLSGALREAAEEAGVEPGLVRPTACYVEDHGTWSYTTVLAEALGPIRARATDPESIDVAWVGLADVPALPLHPAFAAHWPDLAPALRRRLVVVVDVANVMGTVPDGWWRDRTGAARRLLARLAALSAGGIDAAAVGLPRMPAGLRRWLPDVVPVLEGAARAAAADAPLPVVAAGGSGDDAIVATVAERRKERPNDPVVVVTADRGLGGRVEALGALVSSPRALLGALPVP